MAIDLRRTALRFNTYTTPFAFRFAFNFFTGMFISDVV